MGFSPSFFVGLGRERFENSLPCHPLVCVCSLLCVCTLDGLNAVHKFRV